MKLGCSQYIFEKILKYEMSLKSVEWKPSSMRAGEQAETDGRTDRQTDMKLIIAFRKSANVTKTSAFCGIL